MSNPVYNFYNGCCSNSCAAPENAPTGGTPSTAGTIFPIKTGGGSLYANWKTGDVEASRPYFYSVNPVGNNLEFFNSLDAFHFPYKIKELTLFKSSVTGTTTETMDFSIIVMDMAGTLLRTLSTSTIEIISAPEETWIPIPLVSMAADLTINPNEIVIQKFSISNQNTDNWYCHAMVSGLAEMI